MSGENGEICCVCQKDEVAGPLGWVRLISRFNPMGQLLRIHRGECLAKHLADWWVRLLAAS